MKCNLVSLFSILAVCIPVLRCYQLESQDTTEESLVQARASSGRCCSKTRQVSGPSSHRQPPGHWDEWVVFVLKSTFIIITIITPHKHFYCCKSVTNATGLHRIGSNVQLKICPEACSLHLPAIPGPPVDAACARPRPA